MDTSDEPLVADHPEIPEDLALQGFDGAIAYSSNSEASRPLLEEALGFEPLPGEAGQSGWECRGDSRGGLWGYSEPPPERGLQGAGSVHHIAWASQIEDHEAWRERVIEAGARPTPVIDRFYFRSIYFREPSGVLFEIATLGPGFTVRRAARVTRREALAAARLRAPQGAGRARPAADHQPACRSLSSRPAIGRARSSRWCISPASRRASRRAP